MRFKTLYEMNDFDGAKLSKEFRDASSAIMSHLKYEIEDQKEKAANYRFNPTYGKATDRRSDNKIDALKDELKNLKDLYDKAAIRSNYSKIHLWIDNLKQKYNF